MLLDSLHAERAVGTTARQNDADSIFPMILGQSADEDVDRLALSKLCR